MQDKVGRVINNVKTTECGAVEPENGVCERLVDREN